ncbi:MAG: hypothetical protein NUK65_05805 [Firmicutes bacterium]|nr:hypothetical protein [Bacillota bacterium]
MSADRHFTEEVNFRVTKDQKQQILAAAKAKDKAVSDFLRQALREYLAVEEMEGRKAIVQKYVAEAVEEKLKPVENRLAKITAKTAHASAISIFLQAQAMADLGKSDVVHVFKLAREKGLAFVRERGIPNTKDFAEEIDEIERRE